jgi:hypothetical protein
MNRLVARGLAGAFVLGLAVTLSGCVYLHNLANMDWSGHRRRLEETQLKYVHFLRWGEYGAASMLVEPDLREQFLKEIEPYSTVRLSDYEVLDTEFNEDQTEATIRVQFSAYHMNRLVEHRWMETHVWVRDPDSSEWHVRPDIEKIRVALAAMEPQHP